jgi:hypothetical protein
MAPDITRSVDPEQGTEVPSVEVEGQRLRVHPLVCHAVAPRYAQ